MCFCCSSPGSVFQFTLKDNNLFWLWLTSSLIFFLVRVLIFLPTAPKCWVYSQTPHCRIYLVLGSNSSCQAGTHSTNGATSQHLALHLSSCVILFLKRHAPFSRSSLPFCLFSNGEISSRNVTCNGSAKCARQCRAALGHFQRGSVALCRPVSRLQLILEHSSQIYHSECFIKWQPVSFNRNFWMMAIVFIESM